MFGAKKKDWRTIEVMQGEPARAYTQLGMVHGLNSVSRALAETQMRGRAAKKGADAVINVGYTAAGVFGGTRVFGTAVKWR